MEAAHKASVRHGSPIKVSRGLSLEERLDFKKKPAHSFHEALMRLIPTQQRQKPTPRLSRSAPSSDVKTLGQRECQCDPKSKRKDQSESKHGESPQEGMFLDDGQKLEEKSCNSNFRSSAVYCEVKLAEKLNEKGLQQSKIPDAYRTGVCWEVLNEICKLTMPFARVLLSIRDELERAIYSNYVTPHNGSTTFEQVPYFELVGRLEEKNKAMEEEHQRWRDELHLRQNDIVRIEQHMQHAYGLHAQQLRDQVKQAESVSNDLQDKLTTSMDALEAAKSQVRSLQIKSKNLKKELKRARVLVLRAREIEYEKEMERQKHEKLQAQYSQLVHELQHTQSFLEVARTEAADSVSKSEYCAAKIEMLELEGRLSQAQAEVEDIANKVSQMTPRPKWDRVSGKTTGWRATTAEQVSAICRENALLSEQLSCLELEWTAAQVALSELSAKLEPDEQAKKPPAKKGDKKAKKKK